MALDERFVVTSDVDTFFVNKDTGEPLANGTLYFYRDIARNEPKPVYQLTGSPPNYTYTPMGSQITLSAVGTVQNAGGDNEVIYYFPYDGIPEASTGTIDLYYIVCEDAGGTVQFTREAWPNLTAANNPETQNDKSVENQLANPTFTNYFINPGLPQVYTVSGDTDKEFEFAPDWKFLISGTGTVTVQIIPIQGSLNVPTTPPFMLDIDITSGVTSCLLVQRFPKNSGLWTSTVNENVFLYGSYVAQNQNSGTAGIQMLYRESTLGYIPVVIVDGSFTSPYMHVTGTTAAAIPSSGNSDPNGYVEILLSFETASHVRVSSLQLIPSIGDPLTILPIDFSSSNRNEVYQGDYYIPRSAKKNMDSYLVGWDFTVNPFQFGTSLINITTTPNYICDQTIAASQSGIVAYARDTVTEGLSLVGAGTNTAFYLMQYLSEDEVKDMMGNRLSVNVFGYQVGATTAAEMRVYLYRAPNAGATPKIPLLTTGTIGDIAADGTFTLNATAVAAGWTEIPRGGVSTPHVTLNKFPTNNDVGIYDTDKTDYGFSGWEITDPAQIADTNFFAIVVTFKYTQINTFIKINSISVVPGDLPCRPSPKTFSETLRQCQYYYEKSYNTDKQPIAPGTYSGTLIYDQTVYIPFFSGNFQSNIDVYPSLMTFNYKTVKRIPTIPKIYAPDATVDQCLISLFVTSSSGTYYFSNFPVSTYWAVSVSGSDGENGFEMVPIDYSNRITRQTNPAPSGSNVGVRAIIYFQYVADCRYGKV
jgi:hypothetical protein